MDAITKLKSKFQSPSVVGGSRGANPSNSTPSRSRSTSSIPLKRSNPRSNFKDYHDEDLDDELGAGKEGEDWEVGYQSNKMAKTDSNSNPSTSKINSNSSQRKPSYTSNDLQQNDRSAASPSTALHPKQLSASNPGGSPASGGNGEAYYLCQYRKPQARKHKTWDGDAVLIVSVSGSTCSLKCAETCKEWVRKGSREDVRCGWGRAQSSWPLGFFSLIGMAVWLLEPSSVRGISNLRMSFQSAGKRWVGPPSFKNPFHPLTVTSPLPLLSQSSLCLWSQIEVSSQRHLRSRSLSFLPILTHTIWTLSPSHSLLRSNVKSLKKTTWMSLHLLLLFQSYVPKLQSHQDLYRLLSNLLLRFRLHFKSTNLEQRALG